MFKNNLVTQRSFLPKRGHQRRHYNFGHTVIIWDIFFGDHKLAKESTYFSPFKIM